MAQITFAALALGEVVLGYLSWRKIPSSKAIFLYRVLLLPLVWLGLTLAGAKWDLRWYALTLLLFTQAAASGLKWRFWPEKTSTGPKIILKKAGGLILLFAALLPALVFPQYQPLPVTGSHPVQRTFVSFTDKSRREIYGAGEGSRQVNGEFWFPKTPGKYPLIVFSHGSLGVRTSNESLYYELASHGYVVFAIEHPYHALAAKVRGKTVFADSQYTRELARENARENPRESFQLYQKWMSIRMADINFVLDTILNLAETGEGVYQQVDPARVGVIGHSLGGSAALGVGRFREGISAVVALEAPFMADIIGVTDVQFEFIPQEYPVPVLNIYSDDGWAILGDRPQYARNYALLTGGQEHSFNIHLQGSGHFCLTDLSLTSPFITRQLNQHKTKADARDVLLKINQVCLQFFDCYLKGEGTFEVPGGQ